MPAQSGPRGARTGSYPCPGVQRAQRSKRGRQPSGVGETQAVRRLLRLPQQPGQLRRVPSGLFSAWPSCHAQAAGGQGPAHPGHHPGQALLTGSARARLLGIPPPPGAGGGPAPLSGRCAVTHPLPPGQAAGRTGISQGGPKCLWSDFDSSRRAGGRSPPTSAPSRFGGGVAPSARLPPPRDGGSDALGVDPLGLVAGDASSTAGFCAGRGRVGCADGA